MKITFISFKFIKKAHYCLYNNSFCVLIILEKIKENIIASKNYSYSNIPRWTIKFILSPEAAINGTVRQQSKSTVFVPFTYNLFKLKRIKMSRQIYNSTLT